MFDVTQPYIIDNQHKKVIHHLMCAAPLVSIKDILALRAWLFQSSQGAALLMQAGDCAESISAESLAAVQAKQRQFLLMTRIVSDLQPHPVVMIGRIAGQFAKPRSSSWDQQYQQLAYHGDIVNDISLQARQPESKRMLLAYTQAQSVLRRLKFVGRAIYTSHECLVLPYERALTRQDQSYGDVNYAAHLLWLGARSLENKSLINYLSGIINPVAVKLPPTLSASALIDLLLRLNPTRASDRLILVPRLGCSNVLSILPDWLVAVKALPFRVSWMSDPMHANTHYDVQGVKYRLLHEMIAEYQQVQRCCAAEGVFNLGLHLEVSPCQDIQECVSHMPSGIRHYDSLMDPRLNAAQVVAFLQATIKSLA